MSYLGQIRFLFDTLWQKIFPEFSFSLIFSITILFKINILQVKVEMDDSLPNDLIECAFCLETLHQPKSLDCQHSFCLKCLQEYHKGQECKGTISCFKCRASTQVPAGGIAALKTDFRIVKAIEIVARFQEKIKMLQDKEVNASQLIETLLNEKHISHTKDIQDKMEENGMGNNTLLASHITNTSQCPSSVMQCISDHDGEQWPSSLNPEENDTVRGNNDVSSDLVHHELIPNTVMPSAPPDTIFFDVISEDDIEEVTAQFSPDSYFDVRNMDQERTPFLQSSPKNSERSNCATVPSAPLECELEYAEGLLSSIITHPPNQVGNLRAIDATADILYRKEEFKEGTPVMPVPKTIKARDVPAHQHRAVNQGESVIPLSNTIKTRDPATCIYIPDKKGTSVELKTGFGQDKQTIVKTSKVGISINKVEEEPNSPIREDIGLIMRREKKERKKKRNEALIYTFVLLFN